MPIETGSDTRGDEGASPTDRTMRCYQRPPRRSTDTRRAKPLLVAVSAGIVAFYGFVQVAAQFPRGVPRDEGSFQVIGSATCRTCHRALYLEWQTSPHARSAADLTFEQKVDPDCEPCHVPDASAFEDGVGCEACHGPGSEYTALDVMIDDLKRRAAGLQDARGNCTYCHNPGHPFHVERDLEAGARAIHSR